MFQPGQVVYHLGEIDMIMIINTFYDQYSWYVKKKKDNSNIRIKIKVPEIARDY